MTVLQVFGTIRPGIEHCLPVLVARARPVTRSTARGGEDPCKIFRPLLEKCVGHSLKLLEVIKKNWTPLRNLLGPPGVPSWLRAWLVLNPYSGARSTEFYVSNTLCCSESLSSAIAICLFQQLQLEPPASMPSEL